MSTHSNSLTNADGFPPDVHASTDRYRVVAVSPGIGDRWALNGRYVEMVWSELLGPTATLLARRLGDCIDLHPYGIDVSMVEMGASLGVAPSKVRSSLLRLHRFGLSTMWAGQAMIGISDLAPSVSPSLSARLSDAAGREHRWWLLQPADERGAPASLAGGGCPPRALPLRPVHVRSGRAL